MVEKHKVGNFWNFFCFWFLLTPIGIYLFLDKVKKMRSFLSSSPDEFLYTTFTSYVTEDKQLLCWILIFLVFTNEARVFFLIFTTTIIEVKGLVSFATHNRSYVCSYLL